jgi:2-polyprenyl-3-methyl-5-hydroxy-6-metoxy-1,4-benzoquinol methylase
MAVSTTEITSTSIASDNPIHQRQLFAYERACDYVSGDLLEIGCGVGRGVEVLLKKCKTYTALDKNEEVLVALRKQFPAHKFITASVPPFTGAAAGGFDCLVTCQVIEHVEDDRLFVDEIYRVLKPGGVAVITTPNIKMTLTRNPWHVREYTKEELLQLVRRKFRDAQLMGVYGDEKVNRYYEQNKESVRKIMRFDIFNLQHKLPRTILQMPYEILNRINRNRLKEENNGLVMEISMKDFHLKEADDKCYDFFCVLKKSTTV